MLRIVLLSSLATLVLAGCAQEMPVTETGVVSVGPTGLPSNTIPVFCYRTLAGADCYHEPIPAPPNRLIGAYLPVEGEDGEEE